MRPHDQPAGTCLIDPVTAGIAALTGIAGGLFGGGGGGSTTVNQAAAPAAPPPLAPPASAPQGVKPGTKSQQPTFLGSSASAGGQAPGLDSGGPVRSGQKTLLGQ